jgi:hypothetical protein
VHSGATPFQCAIGTVAATGLDPPYSIRVRFDDAFAYRFRVVDCRFTPDELVTERPRISARSRPGRK